METNPGWVELSFAGSHFHGHKHVRVLEVLLYGTKICNTGANQELCYGCLFTGIANERPSVFSNI